MKRFIILHFIVNRTVYQSLVSCYNLIDILKYILGGGSLGPRMPPSAVTQCSVHFTYYILKKFNIWISNKTYIFCYIFIFHIFLIRLCIACKQFFKLCNTIWFITKRPATWWSEWVIEASRGYSSHARKLINIKVSP